MTLCRRSHAAASCGPCLALQEQHSGTGQDGQPGQAVDTAGQPEEHRPISWDELVPLMIRCSRCGWYVCMHCVKVHGVVHYSYYCRRCFAIISDPPESTYFESSDDDDPAACASCGVAGSYLDANGNEIGAESVPMAAVVHDSTGAEEEASMPSSCCRRLFEDHARIRL